MSVTIEPTSSTYILLNYFNKEHANFLRQIKNSSLPPQIPIIKLILYILHITNGGNLPIGLTHDDCERIAFYVETALNLKFNEPHTLIIFKFISDIILSGELLLKFFIDPKYENNFRVAKATYLESNYTKLRDEDYAPRSICLPKINVSNQSATLRSSTTLNEPQIPIPVVPATNIRVNAATNFVQPQAITHPPPQIVQPTSNYASINDWLNSINPPPNVSHLQQPIHTTQTDNQLLQVMNNDNEIIAGESPVDVYDGNSQQIRQRAFATLRSNRNAPRTTSALNPHYRRETLNNVLEDLNNTEILLF